MHRLAIEQFRRSLASKQTKINFDGGADVIYRSTAPIAFSSKPIPIPLTT
jgi:hypothetical protein